MSKILEKNDFLSVKLVFVFVSWWNPKICQITNQQEKVISAHADGGIATFSCCSFIIFHMHFAQTKFFVKTTLCTIAPQ